MNEFHHLHANLHVTLLGINPKRLTQGLNRLGCKHFED